jgi:hypothetical protein
LPSNFKAQLELHIVDIFYLFNLLKQYINEFQAIVTNIQLELSVVEFDMIYLMCDDLKSAMVRITREHIMRLLNVLIENHRNECNK